MSAPRPVTLITGASAGIGWTLAEIFARHGHELVLAARRTPELTRLADKVAAAMRLILADPKVNAILVNIFGGITRGDEVARGLIEARAQQTRHVPMVVRIVGTNAAEAAVLLEEARFETAGSLDEAAAKAVAASKGAAA